MSFMESLRNGMGRMGSMEEVQKYTVTGTPDGKRTIKVDMAGPGGGPQSAGGLSPHDGDNRQINLPQSGGSQQSGAYGGGTGRFSNMIEQMMSSMAQPQGPGVDATALPNVAPQPVGEEAVLRDMLAREEAAQRNGFFGKLLEQAIGRR